MPLLGVVHANFGLVLFASILAWCFPHQFWPCAVHTNSGRVQPAPIAAKCSLHLTDQGGVYVGYDILQWCFTQHTLNPVDVDITPQMSVTYYNPHTLPIIKRYSILSRNWAGFKWRS